MDKQLPRQKTIELNDIDRFFAIHPTSATEIIEMVGDCQSMSEVWDETRPWALFWIAAGCGAVNRRDSAKFAIWCAKHALPFLPEVFKEAVIAKEKFLDNLVTKKRFKAALIAARKQYKAMTKEEYGLYWACVNGNDAEADAAYCESMSAVSAAWAISGLDYCENVAQRIAKAVAIRRSLQSSGENWRTLEKQLLDEWAAHLRATVPNPFR